jgi:hypothetical protein
MDRVPHMRIVSSSMLGKFIVLIVKVIVDLIFGVKALQLFDPTLELDFLVIHFRLAFINFHLYRCLRRFFVNSSSI